MLGARTLNRKTTLAWRVLLGIEWPEGWAANCPLVHPKTVSLSRSLSLQDGTFPLPWGLGLNSGLREAGYLYVIDDTWEQGSGRDREQGSPAGRETAS